MSNETRVFGPPGTGKTTKLAEEIIPMLADKYGHNKILLTSLTKAAAKELGARIDLGESDIIGTLHSICFRALKLSREQMTEHNFADWNQSHAMYDLRGKGKDPGPRCFSGYQYHKNKMIPRENWPKDILAFAEQWEDWKNRNVFYDFVDLVEMAGDMYTPPGSPYAIVLDEAQDFTKLEMSTLRRWATQVKEFWVVGDEDQALYLFNGASAENMLYPELPPEQIVILDQSYRIPRTVHELAQKIIHRVKTRMPKEYKPKEEEGTVTRCQGGFKQPEWVVKKAQQLDGHTMILATCDYMLNDIIKYMRDNGVAFSNPWKPGQKSWNPLETKANNMLRSFLSHGEDEPYWSTEQLLEWIEVVKTSSKTSPAGLIRKQGKAGIKQIKEFFEEDPFAPGLHTCREYLDQILSPEAIQPALDRDVDWLLDNITKAKATSLKFPVRIYKTQGKEGLFQEPKIHCGTIHSVKGAGAENVFVYPDISYAAATERNTREGAENLCRLFYVGVTRTKKNLFLMSKSTPNAFSF